LKCKLCDKFFVSETRFLSLFKFPEICPSCNSKFKPIPKYEVFPIDNGIIKYYYLYDNIASNKKQRDYLERNIKHLYETIKKEDFSILIIVDDLTFATLKTDFKYLLNHKKIILVSVFRFSFEYFVIFWIKKWCSVYFEFTNML